MARYTHLASVESKTAPLFGDFGRDYAMKTFGLTLEQLEAIVGRYSKGKHKGELRGAISWRKVVRGGWLRAGNGEISRGHVVKPNERFDHAIIDPWKLTSKGEPTVLWSDDFKRFGWLPGETREQYDARQKARSEMLRPLQRRALDKAAAIATALSMEQIAKHMVRRDDRLSRQYQFDKRAYAATFVVAALQAEVVRRAKEAA
jgi:hypothetical protein